MKIGIVTFWDLEDNYGQILQCYALQRFLRNMGNDAFVIRYLAPEQYKYSFKKMFSVVMNPEKLLRYIKNKRRIRIINKTNKDHPRGFNDFKEANISMTSKIYRSVDELQNNPPLADAYICGSDQIWGGEDPIYYLNFGDLKAKRIAYAPSFGHKPYPESIEKIRSYLTMLDVITVRELSGIANCEELGFNNVECVLDPTLLLTVNDYGLLEDIIETESDYILLYLLGNSIDYDLDEIYEYANKHNLEIKYIASQGRVDRYSKEYPSIPQWLYLLNHAKYVVTNSYHGTIFSILYNKQFAVFPLTGGYKKMNSRFETIFSLCKIENRYLKHGQFEMIQYPIDYKFVNGILELKREYIREKMEEWLNVENHGSY